MGYFKVCLLLISVALAAAEVEIESSVSNNREARQNRVTVTSTIVVTTSTVAATLVNGICASLVNVTGACRRRRGLWVDRPVFLAFDDDIDEDLERYFDPTSPYKIENTAVPELRSNNKFIDGFPAQQAPSLFALQPSTQYIPLWIPFSSSQTQSRNANPLFFGQIANFFNNIFAVTTTVRTTSTFTSTSYITVTTSTKPFFIKGCTPSPFPFNKC